MQQRHTVQRVVGTLIAIAAVTGWSNAASAQGEPSSAKVKKDVERAGGLVFQGTVLDAKTGEPITGAAVCWGDLFAEEGKRDQARTDSRGHYLLRATQGSLNHRLGVHAAGFAPQWLDLGLPASVGPSQHDFELVKGHSVRGTITDKAGIPLVGVNVESLTATTGFYSSFSSPPPATPFPGPTRQVVTDEEGHFEIGDLPAGKVQISCSSPHRYGGSGNFEVGKPVKLEMSGSGKPGVLQVQVVDSETDQPVTSYHIVRRHEPAQWLVEKGNGQFRFPGERTFDREYHVYVYARGYAPAHQRVRAVADDSDEHLVIRATAHSPFTGQLVDAASGKPIAKAKVMSGVTDDARYFEWHDFDRYIDGYHSLDWVQRTISNDDGTFSLSEGVTAPAGSLFVLAKGYQRTILRPADRRDTNILGRVEIELLPESSILGVVTHEFEVQPDVEVRLWRRQKEPSMEEWYERIQTDAQGRFRYRQLQPGTYTVTAETPNRKLSRQVVVPPGQTITVRIGADVGPHTLRGESIPGASIHLTPQFEWDYQSFATTADAQGKYTIVGLREGQYSVSLHRSYVATGYFMNTNLPPITIKGDAKMDLKVKR